ncbi:hypothetical protein BDZ45DRAFT_807970 [Acephala macrosclerotiorum]|nr:hypothetical protein BDZ45DRAFT_807970 [Acephala macrosclerotiorum]
MAGSGISMTSSVINLTKSLIDFVPSSGSLIDISRETYDWLKRERIDESSFQSCRVMALGLAYPNEAGIDIQRQIKDADKKLMDKVAKLPVRMVVTGSLGRLLGKDPETCYMVSTVAVLMRFHDLEFATDTLCSMMMDKGGHEKEVSLKYSVQRSPVKAVMSKIVESIYLNVVNAGHDLGGLPDELKHLHPHLLDDRAFAGIVMGIQRTEKDVVVRSDRFLADLALWLLTHFQGRVEISVENRVLFDKILSPSPRTVRMIVKEHCAEEQRDCLKKDAPVEAMMSIGDELLTFLKGTDDNDFHPCSYSRQPFYELDDLTSSPHVSKAKLLNRAECNSITHVAKAIMSWILEIAIVPAPDLTGLAFMITLEPGAESKMKVRDLLRKHPGLLSLNTGFLTATQPVLRRPDEEESLDEDLGNGGFEITSSTPGSMIEWFPAAKDLLAEIQPRCSCSACKSDENLDRCKKGCLREAAATRLFILIAHAISDAFQAQDVSGRSNSDDQVTGVTALLSEILDQQLLRWDTWFEVVASTTAGIPWDAFDLRGDNGSSSWAAVQYGSFVAVAPWLDLSTELQVRGCFGIVTVEGNIQGIPDDAGLVQCEMDQFDENYHLQPETFGAGSSGDGSNQMQIDVQPDTFAEVDIALQPDTLKVEVFTAVFRVDQFLYRLMTTVRAGRNIRIVDPSQAIMGLSRSITIRCEHDSDLPLTDASNLRWDDFDHILEAWSSPNVPQDTIRVTKILEENTKVNTVLTMARKGCVIRVADKCFMDTLTYSRFEKRVNIS